jgi:actin-related protein
VVEDATNDPQYQFSTQKYTPGLKMQFPSAEGIISDWDLFEKSWEYALENYVKVDLAGLPVLLAEKPFNPTESRHK